MERFMDVLRRMLEDSSLYLDLIRGEMPEFRACIRLGDLDEAATIVIGEEADIVEGCISPDLEMKMDSETLERILQGRADAFALAARARWNEERPVELKINREEALESGRALLTYLFAPEGVGKIRMRRMCEELAGEAHGGHPIPLIYWNGLRSSWYLVKSGEILNREGERDPWPQLILVLRGRGRAKIHEEEFEVKPKMAIYIPKNCVHQIVAEEDMELIWISWQSY
jgi:hypothetical protein